MIRLCEATLVSFGKFKDFTIVFSDGLQVIYGGNEAGKSTIQLFLKVMLYGIIGSKKDAKGMKIRERIIPWEEKSAEGILRVEIDGKLVEIRRKFGKTSSGDKTEVVDFHTGESMSGFENNKIGEQLWGIPESIFEKTFWLQQGSTSFSGADDELSKRLMNLLETGAEELSVSETLKEFEKDKRALKAKDKRSNPGKLDLLWSLREEKIQERYRILSERGQREAEEKLLKTETQKLEFLKNEEARLQELVDKKKKIQELDSRRKKWEEAQKFASLAQQAEEREVYRRFFHLTESVVQNAENLENRRELLDQTAAIGYDIDKEEELFCQKKRQEKRFSFLLLLGVFSVVYALFFSIIRLKSWEIWTAISGILGILLSVVSFFKMQQSKSAAWQAAERKRELQTNAKSSQDEAAVIEQEYSRILSEYGCNNVAELREGFLLCKQAKMEAEGYRRTCESMLEGENLSELSAEMQEFELIFAKHADLLTMDVELELQKVRQNQIDSVSKIKETEGKLSYVFRGGENPADIETEIIQINQSIEELEKHQKALVLAMDVFKTVSEKRKSDFTPRVNERVNYFLGILTEGKYQDARVSEEYQLRLLPDKAHLYQAEFFSTGTYDQIYFALRLSLATLLGDGKEPLFLDDFLTSYDDERAKAAMDLLLQLAENRQILFFSCHGREVENAKKRNVIIRYLEEEENDGC